MAHQADTLPYLARIDDLWRRSPRARYCLRLVALLAGLAVLFESSQGLWACLYLRPVCRTTTAVLEASGFAARLDASTLGQGFCTIVMERTSLRVIPECTGIFTLFIYLAAVLAYPATLGARAWGAALGAGGFFLFSTARLVVLGIVGQAIPAWLTLFHMGLMVVANLGFALFLWLWWTGKVGRDG